MQHPLFTLQHQQHHSCSKVGKSNDGVNGISSLAFLNYHGCGCNNNEDDAVDDENRKGRTTTATKGIDDDDDDDGYSDTQTDSDEECNSFDEEDDETDIHVPSFRCKSLLLNNHRHHHHHHHQYKHPISTSSYIPNSKTMNQAANMLFTADSSSNSNNHDTTTILLASSHVSGEAYIWDLNKRQVLCSLVSENDCRGPGLSLFRIDPSSLSTTTNGVCKSKSRSRSRSNMGIAYQTRDEKGTITIHDITRSSSSSSSSYQTSIQNTIHCYSRTFCQATSFAHNYNMTDNTNNAHHHTHTTSTCTSDYHLSSIIATPSKHESIVSLWDIRISSSNKNKMVGYVHGAGLDLNNVSSNNNNNNNNNNSNTTIGDLRKEGMLMSISTCPWTMGNHHCSSGNSSSGKKDWNGFAMGCGMESGKVYIHDLRKLNNGIIDIIDNEKNNSTTTTTNNNNTKNGDNNNTMIHSVSHTCIDLGMNPVLSLDMRPSSKSSKSLASFQLHDSSSSTSSSSSSSSVVVVAGTAGDANDQFELPPEQQGTVNIIKATKTTKSTTSNNSSTTTSKINAKLRSKVGTCKINNKKDDNKSNQQTISYMGKPGVSICRFNHTTTDALSSLVSTSVSASSIFAVGGWDKRIRLYSRTNGKLLNVLKGSNDDSISAFDWAYCSSSVRGDDYDCDDNDDSYNRNEDDLVRLGVFAAGSSDGKITLWRTR